MKVKWEIEWTDEWEKKRTNKLPNEQALRTMLRSHNSDVYENIAEK